MVCIRDVFLAVDGHKTVVIDNAFPVIVFRASTCCCNVVAVDVVAAGISHERRARSVVACCHRHLCHACFVNCGRACFVVVVHDVYLTAASASVASVAVAPVVHHAVAEVHALCLNGVAVCALVVACPVVACSAESWRAVLNMCYEVVVERGILSSPDAAKTMLVLCVSGISKSLAEGAPLHGEVQVVVERCYLVDAP